MSYRLCYPTNWSVTSGFVCTSVITGVPSPSTYAQTITRSFSYDGLSGTITITQYVRSIEWYDETHLNYSISPTITSGGKEYKLLRVTTLDTGLATKSATGSLNVYDASGTSTVDENGNFTIYGRSHSPVFLIAIYSERVEVTVTFDGNGGYTPGIDGSQQTPPVTKNVYVGEPYGTLPTPRRTGYNFEGWYTASAGGSLVDSSTIVSISSNHTLYAHWSKIDVYAMLDAAGGTCDPAVLKVTVGVTYAALPTPTRPNYSFDGWYTAATGGEQVTSATTVTDTENHTLYAHWAADPPPQGDGDLIYDDATGRLIYDDRPVPELH